MAIPLGALIVAGAFSAAVAGFSLGQSCTAAAKTARHRATVRWLGEPDAGDRGRSSPWRLSGRHTRTARRGLSGEVHCSSGVEQLLVDYLAMMTLKCSLKSVHELIPASMAERDSVKRFLLRAGVSEIISPRGYFEGRLRIALVAALLAGLVGAVFSTALSLVAAAVAGGLGWMAPHRMIGARIQRRANELERHLPEILEVLALGLRSGLSFDRSLQLYTGHFQTALASGLALAQRQWNFGLLSRPEALRSLAASYDSPLFRRIVENIIRSLRFGSSLAENLESAAVEARQSYQAKKQEQVAKAPVKMMVPTGALILPAMLMLVLGPVLLELMQGV